MSITDRILSTLGLSRFQPYTPEEIAAMWGNTLGVSYLPQTSMNNKQEPIGSGFQSLVTQAYATNPVVFACVNARVQLFSEARLTFQELKDGVPGKLFNGPSTYLRALQSPQPGWSTRMLLKDMLVDSDLAGNSFHVRRPGQIQRLRPDWVVIIAGSENPKATTWDPDVEVLGYGYQPDGPSGGKPWVYFQRSEVAHFAPVRDPLSRWRGMPWMLPIIKDLSSDQAGTDFKVKYFENAATPNLAVHYEGVKTVDEMKKWADLFHKEHEGRANAFKTLFLGQGATVTPIGANLQDSTFTEVQGAGELRIATAAGVPPIMVGLAGGLVGGGIESNYPQARRQFADLTMRPLWADMAASLTTITTVPADSRLWYDDQDIAFLQEDVKDAADIQSTQASAMRQLVDAGFEPKTIIDAITANDFNRLKHSGLYSVQLQPPGTTTPTPEPAPAPADAAPVPKQLMNSAERNGDIRCPECNRLVAKRTAPGGAFEIKCRGCSALVAA